MLALPSSEESIRGLTVDGWIVADEAAFLTDEAHRCFASDACATTGGTICHALDGKYPHRSVLVGLGSVVMSRVCAFRLRSTSTRHCTARTISTRSGDALGEDRYKREFLGIPAGGQVSPFTWEQYERATQAPVHPIIWKVFRPTIIAHDVGHTKDRSTAVVGGKNIYAPGLSLLKEFQELPQGLYGSARAEALARIDRLYDHKTLIFADLSFDPTYAEILVERFGPERVIGLKITALATA